MKFTVLEYKTFFSRSRIFLLLLKESTRFYTQLKIFFNQRVREWSKNGE